MQNIIASNRVISVILIILVLWVYLTWDNNKENFNNIDEPQKWGNNWYYSNQYHQVTPSIANYDISQYRFPSSSQNYLESQQKQNEDQVVSHEVPKPQNIHSGQTQQTGNNETIHQVGAPVNNMVPMDAGYNGLQSIIYGAGSELNNIINQEEINQTDETTVIHELPNGNNNEMTEEEQTLQKVFMPGMVQKQNMEKQLEESPKIIKVQKVNYNMSLVLLLSVILIGFIYYTREY